MKKLPFQAKFIKKITIRDRGITALYIVYTVDMVYAVDMVYTVDTVDTIQTAFHCLNSSWAGGTDVAEIANMWLTGLRGLTELMGLKWHYT